MNDAVCSDVNILRDWSEPTWRRRRQRPSRAARGIYVITPGRARHCRGNWCDSRWAVPVDWKLPPFHHGFILLIDSLEFFAAPLSRVKGYIFFPSGLWVFTERWICSEHSFGWSREFHFGVVCVRACSSRETKSLPTLSKEEINSPIFKPAHFIKPVWRGSYKEKYWRA